MSAALKTQTPKEYEDAFFANLTAVQEKNGMLGSICVVGVSSDENEDEDECQDEGEDDEKGGEESKENKKYGEEKVHSREQLAKLRYILVNKSREEMLKKANKFATCNQAGDYCQMYNTHTGNKTILDIPNQTKSAMRQKTPPLQFDALFALTLALKEVEVWIEDNEFYDEGGECEMAIKELAAAWKKLLSKSNEELGIDAEFTRPGIEALLDQFAEWALEFQSHYEFNWRPKRARK